MEVKAIDSGSRDFAEKIFCKSEDSRVVNGSKDLNVVLFVNQVLQIEVANGQKIQIFFRNQSTSATTKIK